MTAGRERPSIRALPLADERLAEIRAIVGGRRPAVFLDYDGTLTPIVDDPADARLPSATRGAIEWLAVRVPVAIVSGRDLEDVRSLVAIEGIWYAGSHGFELAGPHGEHVERAADYLPALAAAEEALRRAISDIEAARVERKRFAIAVHDRLVPEEQRHDLRRRVRSVAADQPRLRLTGGKRIHELRPDLDWDKGRALRWLIDELGLEASTDVPFYFGDDETDEDAFRALADGGIGVVVRGELDDRPTWADYALTDPQAARDLLAHLAEWMAPDA